MKDDSRFIRTYEQSGLVKGTLEIWVDTVTGVNYLFRSSGYAGGLTPLLDQEGRPGQKAGKSGNIRSFLTKPGFIPVTMGDIIRPVPRERGCRLCPRYINWTPMWRI